MIIFWAACFSAALSVFLIKIKWSYTVRAICELVVLLAAAAGVLLTGIHMTSLLVYIILLAFELLGVVLRVLGPVVLNAVGKCLSKWRKQKYQKQTFDALVQTLPGMRPGIWMFTSIKMLCFSLLILSFFRVL